MAGPSSPPSPFAHTNFSDLRLDYPAHTDSWTFATGAAAMSLFDIIFQLIFAILDLILFFV